MKQGSLNTFVQYVSCISGCSLENLSLNWPSAVRNASFFVQQVDCDGCGEKCSVTESMISPATILFIEFSPILLNTVVIYGMQYSLSRAVRNAGAHFTVAVKQSTRWVYV